MSVCVWACMLTHMYAASITSVNVCVCVCLCMCVPIPFHLIKPWLQQPHTLVCRTQPFITGLEPFTAGFMGASARPSRTSQPRRGRRGNGEGGSRGMRAVDDGRTARGKDGGNPTEWGGDKRRDEIFCPRQGLISWGMPCFLQLCHL